ncbi:MAG: hypothetical protein M5U26_26365 [Planctomycetota bacterium]|nr:hypothetical protein [Planctomycetota bacterium]
MNAKRKSLATVAPRRVTKREGDVGAQDKFGSERMRMGRLARRGHSDQPPAL